MYRIKQTVAKLVRERKSSNGIRTAEKPAETSQHAYYLFLKYVWQ